MPRYRFQWSNFDTPFLAALCDGLGLPATEPVESLRARYGGRPKPDFVRDAWPALLELWLAGDAESRAAIAATLRERGLGETEQPDDLSYLQSCRNSKTMREVVLAQFVAVGEIGGEDDLVPRGPKPDAAGGGEAEPGVEVYPQPEGARDLNEWLGTALGTILGRERAVPDPDGDYPVCFGSSVTFVRLHNEEMPYVELFSPLVRDVKRTPDLLLDANRINLDFGPGKIVVTDNNEVILSMNVIAKTLHIDELRAALKLMVHYADHMDTKIRERHGGEMWSDDIGEEVDV